jgi:protoporphyrinogen oxidase/SAM-dependent methyltransferase
MSQYRSAEKTAVIIGAGPAGLTAAFELLDKTGIKPIVLEQSRDIGGISKTVNYKGNRIDIGGHRFFSKSDKIMKFWLNLIPVQTAPAKDDILLGKRPPPVEDALLEYGNNGAIEADPEKIDKVMLIRHRLSRILFMRKFFDYPISLSVKTIAGLGILRTLKIAASYLRVKFSGPREEESLEDFFVNRFGRELYKTFFRDYTEKVWGVSCDKIHPEWGAQRIKGLSVARAVKHALKGLFRRDLSIGQKEVETSLTSRFLYPKYGPGQLWQQLASIIQSRGGEIRFQHKVIGISHNGQRVISVKVKNERTLDVIDIPADYVFSSMPVKDLIEAMGKGVPEQAREVAAGLCYRDFVTVGLLVKKLKIKNDTRIKTVNDIVPDNWIYIQESDVKVGRLQIFNNWSPYMVADENTVWLGLEYFCNEGDGLWNMPDEQFRDFAVSELVKINVIEPSDVLDGVVIRMEKTYPAYFGSFDRFDVVRSYTDGFVNLFLIGRNGMHRYNNQDHSMLAAMTAVENIVNGVATKDNIWRVNTEEEYHEMKLTAVEHLTDAYAQIRDENPDYNPDVYWTDTRVAYPYYPTVRHRRRFIIDELKKYGVSSNAFIFDYGCGEGGVLSEVKRVFGLADKQLAGCDVSKKAVEIAKQKLKSPHFYAEVFPRLERRCDYVICSEVIEHTKDYFYILRWVKNNLADGGRLILTTQAGKIHASDKYTGHTQHFEIAHLDMVLKHLGFEIEKSRLWGFPFFTLQKYLTNLRFEKVRQNYLEGELSLRKRVVFEIANILFYLHDFIKSGPQIYIVARKK